MSIILNTLIFEKEIQKGISQVALVKRIHDIGVNGIEVRREYFKNYTNELEQLKNEADKYNMTVNYSVPESIFTKDGTINEKLKDYFQEGKQLGATKIKFNIGNFKNFKGNLDKALKQFPIDDIETNIENDQTEISGTLEAIKSFLQAIYSENINIGYVYDLGNWAFTHGDALKSANELSKYTRYVHLKNVINKEGKLQTSDNLNIGMYDWRLILKKLPVNVDVALEYPMESDEFIYNQLKLLNK
ncbi:sugar phosphate isomerase/epimerase [Bombilactobacillus bombi]|uniref:sugar phosphate isomerase/epimerase family protein n=1 Tax=Bombilactobacillus bombi TaxID=1303590 RepID=UPI000E574B3A|nr:TIM barrel protein [Bombilactobacillus bombi]AXX65089.1 sugar phosphate isomerase/epimerase [Bombilactobacillus bombi]